MASWNVWKEVCERDEQGSVGVVGHKQRLLGCGASVSGGLVLPLSGQAVVLQRNGIHWISPAGDGVQTA